MAVDISGIKSSWKTIMQSANTTTADYDLSTGLSQRVQKILKVNPLKIPVQPSFFPYVTIYVDNKAIELQSMAKDQVTGIRWAEISFNIVGAVWEQTIADNTADEADEEIEKLMENAEEILRRSFKLSDTVKWTLPESTAYHTLPLDEQAHMRVGLFSVLGKLQY